MTEIIGEHGLFCITDTDYAAFALAMQCNAEATDAALTSVNNSLGGYLNRPWFTVTNSLAMSIDDDQGGGTVGPEGIVGENMTSRGSGTGVPTIVRNNFPAGVNVPRGIWLVGSSINWTFGALTANSYRMLMVFATPEIGGIASYTNAVQLFRMRDYQGDAGATGALTTVGMLDSRSGHIADFSTFISHANVASNMTVAANNWRFWGTYLGSGLAF